MTIPNITAHIVEDGEIGSLCWILSREIYQPTCIQVLYFILQSGVQHDTQEWNQLGPALRKSHGDSLQIATFGLAPNPHRAEERQDVEEAGLVDAWSVAILWKDEHDAGICGRFWISSEVQATYGSSLEGRHHTDERSSALLQAMCRTFFEPFLRRHSSTSIFFNGTNQRWTPLLCELGHKEYDGICTKAARKVSLQQGSKVECPAGYRLRPLEEKDIDTVIASNKIKFSREYVRSRLYMTAAVVNAETDELASWAITHNDMSIGALHTAPAYRKKGLAAVVVAQIGGCTIRNAISRNPLASSVLKDNFWVHAECEAYNVVAMNWFCSLGFEKVIDNTWTMIEFV